MKGSKRGRYSQLPAGEEVAGGYQRHGNTARRARVSEGAGWETSIGAASRAEADDILSRLEPYTRQQRDIATPHRDGDPALSIQNWPTPAGAHQAPGGGLSSHNNKPATRSIRHRSRSPNALSVPALPSVNVTKSGLQVWVRARPLLPHEQRLPAMPPTAKMYAPPNDGAITICNPASQTASALVSSYRSYCVDKAFWSASDRCRSGAPFASQEEIFDSVADAADLVVAGFNYTVMAYGPMRSGKTYTMFGPEKRKAFDDSEIGLVPRLADALIVKVDDFNAKASHRRMFLEVAIVEVYINEVYDLLKPSSPPRPAQVVIQTKSSPYGEQRQANMPGLSWKPIETASAFHAVVSEAMRRRSVRVTDPAVDASSKSHCVVLLQVTTVFGKAPFPLGIKAHALLPEDQLESTRFSRATLSLVDLAGSEDLRKGTVGLTRDESVSINKSLSILRMVVERLAHPGELTVPFRDSTLTKLLINSLGGNCKTVLITTVSPHVSSFRETKQTLRFAEIAKEVCSFVTLSTPEPSVDARIFELRRALEDPSLTGWQRDQLQAMVDDEAKELASYENRTERLKRKEYEQYQKRAAQQNLVSKFNRVVETTGEREQNVEKALAEAQQVSQAMVDKLADLEARAQRGGDRAQIEAEKTRVRSQLDKAARHHQMLKNMQAQLLADLDDSLFEHLADDAAEYDGIPHGRDGDRSGRHASISPKHLPDSFTPPFGTSPPGHLVPSAPGTTTNTSERRRHHLSEANTQTDALPQVIGSPMLQQMSPLRAHDVKTSPYHVTLKVRSAVNRDLCIAATTPGVTRLHYVVTKGRSEHSPERTADIIDIMQSPPTGNTVGVGSVILKEGADQSITLPTCADMGPGHHCLSYICESLDGTIEEEVSHVTFSSQREGEGQLGSSAALLASVAALQKKAAAGHAVLVEEVKKLREAACRLGKLGASASEVAARDIAQQCHRVAEMSSPTQEDLRKAADDALSAGKRHPEMAAALARTASLLQKPSPSTTDILSAAGETLRSSTAMSEARVGALDAFEIARRLQAGGCGATPSAAATKAAAALRAVRNRIEAPAPRNLLNTAAASLDRVGMLISQGDHAGSLAEAVHAAMQAEQAAGCGAQAAGETALRVASSCSSLLSRAGSGEAVSSLITAVQSLIDEASSTAMQSVHQGSATELGLSQCVQHLQDAVIAMKTTDLGEAVVAFGSAGAAARCGSEAQAAAARSVKIVEEALHVIETHGDDQRVITNLIRAAENITLDIPGQLGMVLGDLASSLRDMASSGPGNVSVLELQDAANHLKELASHALSPDEVSARVVASQLSDLIQTLTQGNLRPADAASMLENTIRSTHQASLLPILERPSASESACLALARHLRNARGSPSVSKVNQAVAMATGLTQCPGVLGAAMEEVRSALQKIASAPSAGSPGQLADARSSVENAAAAAAECRRVSSALWSMEAAMAGGTPLEPDDMIGLAEACLTAASRAPGDSGQCIAAVAESIGSAAVKLKSGESLKPAEVSRLRDEASKAAGLPVRDVAASVADIANLLESLASRKAAGQLLAAHELKSLANAMETSSIEHPEARSGLNTAAARLAETVKRGVTEQDLLETAALVRRVADPMLRLENLAAAIEAGRIACDETAMQHAASFAQNVATEYPKLRSLLHAAASWLQAAEGPTGDASPRRKKGNEALLAVLEHTRGRLTKLPHESLDGLDAAILLAKAGGTGEQLTEVLQGILRRHDIPNELREAIEEALAAHGAGIPPTTRLLATLEHAYRRVSHGEVLPLEEVRALRDEAGRISGLGSGVPEAIASRLAYWCSSLAEKSNSSPTEAKQLVRELTDVAARHPEISGALLRAADLLRSADAAGASVQASAAGAGAEISRAIIGLEESRLAAVEVGEAMHKLAQFGYTSDTAQCLSRSVGSLRGAAERIEAAPVRECLLNSAVGVQKTLDLAANGESSAAAAAIQRAAALAEAAAGCGPAAGVEGARRVAQCCSQVTVDSITLNQVEGLLVEVSATSGILNHSSVLSDGLKWGGKELQYAVAQIRNKNYPTAAAAVARAGVAVEKGMADHGKAERLVARVNTAVLHLSKGNASEAVTVLYEAAETAAELLRSSQIGNNLQAIADIVVDPETAFSAVAPAGDVLDALSHALGTPGPEQYGARVICERLHSAFSREIPDDDQAELLEACLSSARELIGTTPLQHQKSLAKELSDAYEDIASLKDQLKEAALAVNLPRKRNEELQERLEETQAALRTESAKYAGVKAELAQLQSALDTMHVPMDRHEALQKRAGELDKFKTDTSSLADAVHAVQRHPMLPQTARNVLAEALQAFSLSQGGPLGHGSRTEAVLAAKLAEMTAQLAKGISIAPSDLEHISKQLRLAGSSHAAELVQQAMQRLEVGNKSGALASLHASAAVTASHAAQGAPKGPRIGALLAAFAKVQAKLQSGDAVVEAELEAILDEACHLAGLGDGPSEIAAARIAKRCLVADTPEDRRVLVDEASICARRHADIAPYLSKVSSLLANDQPTDAAVEADNAVKSIRALRLTALDTHYVARRLGFGDPPSDLLAAARRVVSVVDAALSNAKAGSLRTKLQDAADSIGKAVDSLLTSDRAAAVGQLVEGANVASEAAGCGLLGCAEAVSRLAEACADLSGRLTTLSSIDASQQDSLLRQTAVLADEAASLARLQHTASQLWMARRGLQSGVSGREISHQVASAGGSAWAAAEGRSGLANAVVSLKTATGLLGSGNGGAALQSIDAAIDSIPQVALSLAPELEADVSLLESLRNALERDPQPSADLAGTASAVADRLTLLAGEPTNDDAAALIVAEHVNKLIRSMRDGVQPMQLALEVEQALTNAKRVTGSGPSTAEASAMALAEKIRGMEEQVKATPGGTMDATSRQQLESAVVAAQNLRKETGVVGAGVDEVLRLLSGDADSASARSGEALVKAREACEGMAAAAAGARSVANSLWGTESRAVAGEDPSAEELGEFAGRALAAAARAAGASGKCIVDLADSLTNAATRTSQGTPVLLGELGRLRDDAAKAAGLPVRDAKLTAEEMASTLEGMAAQRNLGEHVTLEQLLACKTKISDACVRHPEARVGFAAVEKSLSELGDRLASGTRPSNDELLAIAASVRQVTNPLAALESLSDWVATLVEQAYEPDAFQAAAELARALGDQHPGLQHALLAVADRLDDYQRPPSKSRDLISTSKLILRHPSLRPEHRAVLLEPLRESEQTVEILYATLREQFPAIGRTARHVTTSDMREYAHRIIGESELTHAARHIVASALHAAETAYDGLTSAVKRMAMEPLPAEVSSAVADALRRERLTECIRAALCYPGLQLDVSAALHDALATGSTASELACCIRDVLNHADLAVEARMALESGIRSSEGDDLSTLAAAAALRARELVDGCEEGDAPAVHAQLVSLATQLRSYGANTTASAVASAASDVMSGNFAAAKATIDAAASTASAAVALRIGDETGALLTALASLQRRLAEGRPVTAGEVRNLRGQACAAAGLGAGPAEKAAAALLPVVAAGPLDAALEALAWCAKKFPDVAAPLQKVATALRRGGPSAVPKAEAELKAVVEAMEETRILASNVAELAWKLGLGGVAADDLKKAVVEMQQAAKKHAAKLPGTLYEQLHAVASGIGDAGKLAERDVGKAVKEAARCADVAAAAGGSGMHASAASMRTVANAVVDMSSRMLAGTASGEEASTLIPGILSDVDAVLAQVPPRAAGSTSLTECKPMLLEAQSHLESSDLPLAAEALSSVAASLRAAADEHSMTFEAAQSAMTAAALLATGDQQSGFITLKHVVDITATLKDVSQDASFDDINTDAERLAANLAGASKTLSDGDEGRGRLHLIAAEAATLAERLAQLAGKPTGDAAVARMIIERLSGLLRSLQSGSSASELAMQVERTMQKVQHADGLAPSHGEVQLTTLLDCLKRHIAKLTGLEDTPSDELEADYQHICKKAAKLGSESGIVGAGAGALCERLTDRQGGGGGGGAKNVATAEAAEKLCAKVLATVTAARGVAGALLGLEGHAAQGSLPSGRELGELAGKALGLSKNGPDCVGDALGHLGANLSRAAAQAQGGQQVTSQHLSRLRVQAAAACGLPVTTPASIETARIAEMLQGLSEQRSLDELVARRDLQAVVQKVEAAMHHHPESRLALKALVAKLETLRPESPANEFEDAAELAKESGGAHGALIALSKEMDHLRWAKAHGIAVDPSDAQDIREAVEALVDLSPELRGLLLALQHNLFSPSAFGKIAFPSGANPGEDTADHTIIAHKAKMLLEDPTLDQPTRRLLSTALSLAQDALQSRKTLAVVKQRLQSTVLDPSVPSGARLTLSEALTAVEAGDPDEAIEAFGCIPMPLLTSQQHSDVQYLLGTQRGLTGDLAHMLRDPHGLQGIPRVVMHDAWATTIVSEAVARVAALDDLPQQSRAALRQAFEACGGGELVAAVHGILSSDSGRLLPAKAQAVLQAAVRVVLAMPSSVPAAASAAKAEPSKYNLAALAWDLAPALESQTEDVARELLRNVVSAFAEAEETTAVDAAADALRLHASGDVLQAKEALLNAGNLLVASSIDLSSTEGCGMSPQLSALLSKVAWLQGQIGAGEATRSEMVDILEEACSLAGLGPGALEVAVRGLTECCGNGADPSLALQAAELIAEVAPELKPLLIACAGSLKSNDHLSAATTSARVLCDLRDLRLLSVEVNDLSRRISLGETGAPLSETATAISLHHVALLPRDLSNLLTDVLEKVARVAEKSAKIPKDELRSVAEQLEITAGCHVPASGVSARVASSMCAGLRNSVVSGSDDAAKAQAAHLLAALTSHCGASLQAGCVADGMQLASDCLVEAAHHLENEAKGLAAASIARASAGARGTAEAQDNVVRAHQLAVYANVLFLKGQTPAARDVLHQAADALSIAAGIAATGLVSNTVSSVAISLRAVADGAAFDAAFDSAALKTVLPRLCTLAGLPEIEAGGPALAIAASLLSALKLHDRMKAGRSHNSPAVTTVHAPETEPLAVALRSVGAVGCDAAPVGPSKDEYLNRALLYKLRLVESCLAGSPIGQTLAHETAEIVTQLTHAAKLSGAIELSPGILCEVISGTADRLVELRNVVQSGSALSSVSSKEKAAAALARIAAAVEAAAAAVAGLRDASNLLKTAVRRAENGVPLASTELMDVASTSSSVMRRDHGEGSGVERWGRTVEVVAERLKAIMAKVEGGETVEPADLEKQRRLILASAGLSNPSAALKAKQLAAQLEALLAGRIAGEPVSPSDLNTIAELAVAASETFPAASYGFNDVASSIHNATQTDRVITAKELQALAAKAAEAASNHKKVEDLSSRLHALGAAEADAANADKAALSALSNGLAGVSRALADEVPEMAGILGLAARFLDRNAQWFDRFEGSHDLVETVRAVALHPLLSSEARDALAACLHDADTGVQQIADSLADALREPTVPPAARNELLGAIALTDSATPAAVICAALMALSNSPHLAPSLARLFRSEASSLEATLALVQLTVDKVMRATDEPDEVRRALLEGFATATVGRLSDEVRALPRLSQEHADILAAAARSAAAGRGGELSCALMAVALTSEEVPDDLRVRLEAAVDAASTGAAVAIKAAEALASDASANIQQLQKALDAATWRTEELEADLLAANDSILTFEQISKAERKAREQEQADAAQRMTKLEDACSLLEQQLQTVETTAEEATQERDVLRRETDDTYARLQAVVTKAAMLEEAIDSVQQQKAIPVHLRDELQAATVTAKLFAAQDEAVRLLQSNVHVPPDLRETLVKVSILPKDETPADKEERLQVLSETLQ
eukprot:gene10906-16771_t